MEISFFSVLFINSIRTETRCLGKVEKIQINVATNSKKRALVIQQEPFQSKRINKSKQRRFVYYRLGIITLFSTWITPLPA
jgi:sporulation protein YlmC with PRC-barrel domain